MKTRPTRALHTVVIVALSGTALVVFAAIRASASEEGGDGPPPLVVDMTSPLLLEEPAKNPETKSHKADNDACYVCHANYQEEALVGWHAVEDIGCVDCHGDSFAHRNDESNTTPPEVMFPASKINASCAKCHKDHDVPAHEVIARFLERSLDKPRPEALVCTDCHGHHRLEFRTVVWNKQTGELIPGQQSNAPEKGDAGASGQ